MENPCVELFVSSLAQNLKTGYVEFINRLSLNECKEEINSLIYNSVDAKNASKASLLECLLLNFHRQASLSLQSKAALEKDVESLRVQNACLLQEVNKANKKAVRYLLDLHSAESDLCFHKEELLKLRSEHLSTPELSSRCDSGYSDSQPPCSERLTPPHKSGEEFLNELNSLGTKSYRSDISDKGSSVSGRISTQNPFYSHMHDTAFHAHLDGEGVRSVQDYPSPSSGSSLQHHGDNSHAGFTYPPERTAGAHERHAQTSECFRFKVLESLAKDIDHFDPDNCDHNIDNYFTEIDQALMDLPNATEREKIKLVEKSSSKAVRKFIQELSLRVRNNYTELRQALIEEFSSSVDEITSMAAALQVKHTRREHPRDYFQRLRKVYFQGRNAPSLEENPNFKSLFVRNLHPCIRTHVVFQTSQGKLSMLEIKKISQMAWESVVPPQARDKIFKPDRSTPKVSPRQTISKSHPHNRTKGGDKKKPRDRKHNRHVHWLPRDRHSHNRSCWRPYSEILAQRHNQPLNYSDDDRSISEYSSEHDHDRFDSNSESHRFSSYRCYSPKPQVPESFRY